MLCNLDQGEKCFKNVSRPSEFPGQLTDWPEWFLNDMDMNGRASTFNQSDGPTLAECLNSTDTGTEPTVETDECLWIINDAYNELRKFICPGYERPSPKGEEDTMQAQFVSKMIRGMHRSHEFYDVKEEEQTCDDIYDMLQSSEYYISFWNTFRHMMIGQLIYYPKTALTDQIVAEMNETFVALEMLQKMDVAGLLGELKTVAKCECEGSTDCEEKPVCTALSLFETFLNQFLTILKCFDLNKTTGFKSDETNQLIDHLDELMCNFQTEEKLTRQSEMKDDILNCTTRLWSVIYFNYEDENGTLQNVTDDMTLDDPETNHLTYTLRLPRDLSQSTMSIQPYFWSAGSRSGSGSMKHFIGGFIYLQNMIDSALAKLKSGDDEFVAEGVWMQMFPYPCYTPDSFFDAISGLLPMLLCLSWVFSVSVTVRNVVAEKESRKKEMMRIMGCSSGTLWASWWIDTFMMMFISSFLLAILIKFGDVFHHADFFLLFIWLLCFAFSSCGVIFLLSTFFSSANLAAACGGILFFFLYMPYNLCAIFQANMTLAMKYGSMVVPTVALGYGSWQFADFEKESIGAQWYNIMGNVNDTEYTQIPIGMSMIFMVMDGIIYYLIAWYIDAVFPGQYGVPRAPYFFLQKSYWTGKSEKSGDEKEDIVRHDVPSELREDKPEVGVELINLTKVYSSGCCTKREKVAVNELSLQFYNDEITSFLGHNGAGKTTTMSMLTGMYTPTKGTAYLSGYDVHNQMDDIRKQLGFCPQHNVLWDDLTCDEHIYFFSTLKGQDSKETKRETVELLANCGLTEKKNEQSKNLSGGMKRKLSVALAFCAKSKIVLLDEPTAGVDPYARRAIWDLLLKYKSNKTIILSTHHMDEADVLGDRIAIIAQGELRCVGSPLWLRTNYGGGYYLSVESEDIDGVQNLFNDYNNEVSDDKKTSRFEVKGAESVYQIPYVDLKEQLSVILNMLDKNKKQLSINSYGIRDTSLEEIFISIAKEEDEDITIDGDKSNKVHPEDDDNVQVQVDKSGHGIRGTIKGKKLLWNQFCAVFYKRWTSLLGNKKTFAASVVVPPVFILISLLFTLAMPDFMAMPPLEITATMYDSSVYAQKNKQTTFISLDNEKEKDLYDAMLSKPGLGTYCTASKRIEAQRKFYLDAGGPDRYCKDENDFELDREWNMDDYRWSANFTAQYNHGETKYNVSNYNDCYCSVGDYVNAMMDCGTFDKRFGDGNSTKMYTGGDHFPMQKDTYAGFQIAHLNQFNISDWLTKTVDVQSFTFQRFGGFSLGADQEISGALKLLLDKYVDGFAKNVERFYNPSNVKVWYTNFGYHASVAYYNVISNGILRRAMKNSGVNASEIAISTFSQPYDYTINNIDDAAFVQLSRDTFIAICIVFSMAFIPASFTIFLIEERANGGKHLQLLAGINPTIYWVANYLWDMIIFVFPTFLAILIFFAFDLQCFISTYNIGPVILLFMLFGISVTPLMYPATWFFETPSSAYVALTALNLFIGINTTIAVNIMMVIAESDPDLEYVLDILEGVFLIFPHYCLGRALIEMAIDQAYYDAYAELGFPQPREYSMLDWDHNGPNCLAMGIEFFVFSGLVLLIQYNFCIKRQAMPLPKGTQKTGDEDVRNEEQRVYSPKNDDILKIEGLSKVFQQRGTKDKLLAVNGVSVSIPKSQCFGLLGVNGAGKTTTFKMLTTELVPSGGDANINGVSLVESQIEIRKDIGYCPQFDGLNATLTAKEHIEYYAKLRGISSDEIPIVVDWVLSEMNLVKYR